MTIRTQYSTIIKLIVIRIAVYVIQVEAYRLTIPFRYSTFGAFISMFLYQVLLEGMTRSSSFSKFRQGFIDPLVFSLVGVITEHIFCAVCLRVLLPTLNTGKHPTSGSSRYRLRCVKVYWRASFDSICRRCYTE